MNISELVMLAAGGLFAGGALTFAWSRVPIWRRMPVPQFSRDFAETLRWTDKIQPALLITSATSAAAFAITADGTAAILAGLGAGGLVLTLLATLAILVPLQRRIVATPVAAAEAIEEMRLRWFRGNLGRAVVATLSFALLAAAGAA
jgi:hypothetical protein